MKKKIIVAITLITSLFITIVCILLATYLLAVNDYGLNINHDHLFPDFQITRLDDNYFSSNQYNTNIYSNFKDNSEITVQNNSNQDISLDIYYPNFKSGIKYNNLGLYQNTYAPITQSDPTSIIVNPVPNKYDVYYVNNHIFSSNRGLSLSLRLDYSCSKTCDKENQTDDYDSKIVTIKKGETYEVKLS